MMAGEKYLQILISEWYFNLLFPGGGGGAICSHAWVAIFSFILSFNEDITEKKTTLNFNKYK